MNILDSKPILTKYYSSQTEVVAAPGVPIAEFDFDDLDN
jgi:hypothetical protein